MYRGQLDEDRPRQGVLTTLNQSGGAAAAPAQAGRRLRHALGRFRFSARAGVTRTLRLRSDVRTELWQRRKNSENPAGCCSLLLGRKRGMRIVTSQLDALA